MGSAVGYGLGVDLGNSYVAAAVSRGGDAEMATLGQGSLVIPAAVFVGADGAVTVGQQAVRRGLAEPERMAVGFKRRLGHPVAIGETSRSSQELLAELLRSVVATVAREWGGQLPDRLMLARPATWDGGRRALFDQVPALAGLAAVETGSIAEPEAVLTHYAASRRLPDGALVAVYDLGGGKFEVSVVRSHAGGIELVGQPQGIARLGGVDFDEALIDLVDYSLGGPLGRLDPSSPESLRAMARLREQCVYAKEVLSHDDVVDIPVQLDRGDLEARVTREDLEYLLRPRIDATVTAVRAAIASAGAVDEQLDSILLVGGSSRIPLVSRTLREAFRCPVRANVNPDNAVALGAALAVAGPPAGGRHPGAGGPGSTGGWLDSGSTADRGPRTPNGPRNPTGPRVPAAPAGAGIRSGPTPPTAVPPATPTRPAPPPGTHPTPAAPALRSPVAPSMSTPPAPPAPPAPSTPPAPPPSAPRPPSAIPQAPPAAPRPPSATTRPPAAPTPAPIAPQPPLPGIVKPPQPPPPTAVPSPATPSPVPTAPGPAPLPPPAPPSGGSDAAPALFVPSPPPAVAAARPVAVAQPPAPVTGEPGRGTPTPEQPVRVKARRDRQASIEVRRFATLVTVLLLLTAAGVVLLLVLLGIKITI